VAAGTQELDVEVVVPSIAAENTPTQIPESLEVQRTTINVSRQEDKTLQLKFIVSEEEWQRALPDSVDPILDNSQVGAEHMVSLHTEENANVPTIQGAPNQEVFHTTAATVGT
jgi:hypothetical protein